MTVATTSLLGEQNGSRFEIVIEIGQPYRCSDSPEEWACPIALRGLYAELRDMHGGDAFQALCLAVRLALRVCPETSYGITKFSQHESD
jgi:hypothetical protein